ncbi:hypothetical protein HPB49_002761 [Dermacentor silvarum]|uniref:Uncharacterized protein n=1 Tax=Dermacentor silvarum TaxID=543639 RepID=A0ACB8DAR7_DERSI|nr:replication protein A 14 kDa subunit [Dermacentor silvarum]KAH7964996.1 hypothetical protein HPB49_002761 [Dermacentor silvarum]
MRVNAKLLANYQRQTVCLVGKVLQSEPQGMSFKMESPDKQVVQVIMKNPIQEPLEGIIEVIGEVTAKLAIVCESYVRFPPATTEDFDMATYNAVVETIQNVKDYYPTMASA